MCGDCFLTREQAAKIIWKMYDADVQVGALLHTIFGVLNDGMVEEVDDMEMGPGQVEMIMAQLTSPAPVPRDLSRGSHHELWPVDEESKGE